MIKPTKRKLTYRFISVIILFNLLTLTIISIFSRYYLQSNVRDHLRHEVFGEFLPVYFKGDHQLLSKYWEDNFIQIYFADGSLETASLNPLNYNPPVNKKLLKSALQGNEEFKRLTNNKHPFLSYYFPVDETHSGRVVTTNFVLTTFETNILVISLIGILLILIFSFFISRYLVNQAMIPISEIFTYQETFSSNVTHELLTPLASLKGNFEVALRRKRNPEEYQDILKLGGKEVDRLTALLNNLYLLASSKFKPLDLFKEEVDLSDLIHEILEFAQPEIKEKKYELAVATDVETVCSCDRSLIKLTLQNLIENAVKYTPPEGNIQININFSENNIQVEITNTAPTDNPINYAKLFEPFERGAKIAGRNIPGKGLGLYLSRYIARSHGGDIKPGLGGDGLFSLLLIIPKKTQKSRWDHQDHQKQAIG